MRVLVDAIVRKVSHLDPVNAAFGTNVSLLEVITELENILGRRLEIERFPTRVGDVKRSQAACDTLLSLFPEVQPVPLRSGLEATVEWFRSIRLIGNRRSRAS